MATREPPGPQVQDGDTLTANRADEPLSRPAAVARGLAQPKDLGACLAVNRIAQGDTAAVRPVELSMRDARRFRNRSIANLQNGQVPRCHRVASAARRADGNVPP